MSEFEVEVTHAVTLPATPTPLLILVNSIVKTVDFTTLNAAIDNIGNVSGNLNSDEKAGAVQIIETWNSQVIQALWSRKYEMENLVHFFDNNSFGERYEDTLEQIGPDLAQRTGTTSEFLVYTATMDALTKHRHTRPGSLDIDEDTPKVKRMKLEQLYDLELLKYQMDERRLLRRLREADSAWKKLLREHADVQALLKAVNKQVKGIKGLTDECTAKAQVAKLNVVIGDLSVRQSIRDMLNFAKDI